MKISRRKYSPADPVRWEGLPARAQALLLRRPKSVGSERFDGEVSRILEAVRTGGDRALRNFTREFDGVAIERLGVGAAEFAEAERAVPAPVKAAMKDARARLLVWHRAGMAREFQVETAEGVRCGRVLRGISRVGLYVPAGSAPLPSTALMLGVPAKLAGCENVILCTPPRPDGRADPMVLIAARLTGISRVFKVGGAQAIAALAFGTSSIPACHKLFGPGNRYVMSAKRQVAAMGGGPAIDMPAGPSEVLVIADSGASPSFVAADLLAQAEHGPDSQVILLADSMAFLERVIRNVKAQIETLPRAQIAREALKHARFIGVDDVDTAIDISNKYAPEHLILALRNPSAYLPKVRAAGSVFLGDHTPETLGDYCSGTNHVLPTGGAATAFSGISVASFQNSISVQRATPRGLLGIGACAATLARAEGLEAHARAVTLRLESLA